MPRVLAPLASPSSGVTAVSLPGPCAGSILGTTPTLHSPEPSGAPPSLACPARALLPPPPQSSWEATERTASFVIRWLSCYEHNLPPQSQKRPCPLRTHHVASPSSEGPGGGGLITQLSNRKEEAPPRAHGHLPGCRPGVWSIQPCWLDQEACLTGRRCSPGLPVSPSDKQVDARQ